ncbi:winged helix DNA-binding domain-containing protein [Nocardia camponoti]|uniref:Winged helix DNA-binding domain-containing protein n=1 Tax=Nocardia camponoti TaxID=1616106 RepID=A0A917QTV1_9NOCA|nr:winged helix DNA-binding domain-containing protein [Nocardia camponoti]GGK68391.1 hypothetical protein GCM10011591_45670 [Nocardia camponoti]
MPSIDTAQRRARLATRHRLAPAVRSTDPVEIARSLVVLHATDPATVYLSIAARGVDLTPADVQQALYEDRALVRLLAMRRTMFVAPTELLPVLQSSCCDALARKQRKTYAQFLAKAGAVDGDVSEWLIDVENETHAVVLERGAATGLELGKAVPRLQTKVDTAPGKSYSKPVGITTWVLVTLGAEGRIVRGRPGGGWTSSSYTWVPAEKWLPPTLSAVAAAEARTELVRQWLYAFGPAPLSDLKWWTGWTVAEVRSALAGIDTVEVDLDDGTTGLVLADDLPPVATPDPWAALLPALDPTPMGWQSRDWFLGPHAPALFDRNGNVGPTIWADGRIVGGWAQRADGEIVARLLEDATTETRALIDAEVARLQAFYGETRAIPRFRTPLEKELTA